MARKYDYNWTESWERIIADARAKRGLTVKKKPAKKPAKKKARKYARRTKMGKYYAERNKKGQIKKMTKISRSLAADRRSKSKKKPPRRGMGNKGDY